MANDFLKIFSKGWERFKSAVPSYDKPHYNKQVEAVLRCGDPVFGFSQYLCLNCGKDSRIVAHSCKSKFCLRCGRVDGENFAQSSIGSGSIPAVYKFQRPSCPLPCVTILLF